jgi:hypothetical protein
LDVEDITKLWRCDGICAVQCDRRESEKTSEKAREQAIAKARQGKNGTEEFNLSRTKVIKKVAKISDHEIQPVKVGSMGIS